MLSLNRCLNRKRDRPLSRRRDRHAFRMTCGGPRPRPINYLGMALSAFQKSIRARRRLMRLAPRVFDQAVVNREAEAAARDAPLHAELQQAISKVYGVDDAAVAAAWAKSSDSPWPKSPRTLRVIEREMDAREIWLQIGQDALRDFKRFQPHRCLSLSQICRLVTVASRLGRLSTGLETLQPKPVEEPSGYRDFRSALEKIYGEPELTGAKTSDGTKME
jgi:hypothetical protein